MGNFNKIEELLYKKAIQKKSTFFYLSVKVAIALFAIFSVLCFLLFLKAHDLRIFNKAIQFLFASFFIWIVFTYQNIIQKTNHA